VLFKKTVNVFSKSVSNETVFNHGFYVGVAFFISSAFVYFGEYDLIAPTIHSTDN